MSAIRGRGITTLRERPTFGHNMKIRLFLVLVPLGLVGSVSAMSSAQEKTSLPVEKVLQVRSFAIGSFIEASPDGKWLAYVIAGPDTAKPYDKNSHDIWLLNTESGETMN